MPHAFEISVKIDGGFEGLQPVTVRAASLPDALAKAATLPLNVWVEPQDEED